MVPQPLLLHVDNGAQTPKLSANAGFNSAPPGHVESTLPIVILHGLFGDSGNWKQQARLLAEHRTVLCLDLRNHGLSPQADDMDFNSMAADVITTLDHWQIAQCDLVGHSLGGKTGMQLATHYPHRVHRLVTVDIAPVAYPPHHMAIISALQALDLTTLSSRRDADRALFDAIPDTGVRQFLLKALVRRSTQESPDKSPTIPSNLPQWEWRFNLNAIAACYPALSAPPALVEPFNGPHLVISGGASDYVTDDHLPSFHRWLPNSSFYEITDAGHWPHSSHPRAFFEHLWGFLSPTL